MRTQQPSTNQRLIKAAADLLDAGGDSAVTLRAVGHAVGVSHNAPYKHFADRNALLCAVAMQDFRVLIDAFHAARACALAPRRKLERALAAFVEYGRAYPARYRLLFGNPELAVRGGPLEAVAMESFAAFAAIVDECQRGGALPAVPTAQLTGLIYASAHGLVDLAASGRMREEKGLHGVLEGVSLLLDLIAPG